MSVNKEAVAAFAEAFSFLTHEREDVRKMAIHGIAEQSKDNTDLCAYLVSKPAGQKSMDVLLLHLHIGSVKLLGDILTVLINTSVDATCAEVLVQKKGIRKAMRLLDSFQNPHVDLPSPAFTRSLQELTLMLLNNLTASYIIAVDEFLQKEDEDMRGFYLGKLQSQYDRCAEEEEQAAAATAAGKEEDANPPPPPSSAVTEAGTSSTKASATTAAAVAASRDIRRWMLQIVLNLTRCVDGQEQVLSDDKWQATLNKCLSSPAPSHRLLTAQVLRNCACSSTPFYALLLKHGILLRVVQRLTDNKDFERETEIQQCLAEFIASMLESEAGVEQLESINAKKLLSAVITQSKKHYGVDVDEPRVQDVTDHTVEDEISAGINAAAAAGAVLNLSVAEFVEHHILIHLDDIMDAYLAPGSDEID